jgi:photosystem I protein PsaO
VPANIPVSGFGGQSLFSLFTASIGEQLAHFPTGPALTADTTGPAVTPRSTRFAVGTRSRSAGA